MKISLKWLQTYFDEPLPSVTVLDDTFTFHAFEVEEQEGDLIDLNVLPNRAADCLSHRGIARELSAILNVPLKSDPLCELIPAFPKIDALKVEIEDPQKCLRYMGALVKGVKVGPSPAWLKEAIEAVGQRSINNVVDATNYVMLNIGQPLHAFDAKKLSQKDGTYTIGVRSAKEGETITILSGETYELAPSVQIITDAHADTPLALAGVKGGKAAELTSETTDLIIESANFDGTITRRAAQSLKLFTDASLRFQNRPSPELAAYGMRDVLALITQVAGGEVITVVDNYPSLTEREVAVHVSLSRINGLLGSHFTMEEVSEVFRRLDLEARIEYDTFTVIPPFERTDIVIPEDLVEEVGRIIGYDAIASQELSKLATEPDQARYRGIEKIKDILVEKGFTEISTQSFAKKGDISLANPLDKNMPALRTNLDDNMKVAFDQAKQYVPLVLMPKQKLKLFEIGTIFTKRGEQIVVKTSEPIPDLPDMKDEPGYMPMRYELGSYRPFSIYPFITRDVALWVPSGTDVASIEKNIREQAGELLVRLDQFDTFEKEGRTSYAFRLVFQSPERTLTDGEVVVRMDAISAALREAGYEVR